MPKPWKPVLSWLIVSAMGVAVLSLAGAFAPPVARRLVLFHLAYGLLGGVGMGWLAREWGLIGTASVESRDRDESHAAGRSWLLPILGGTILVAGGVNMGWVSYRQFEQARRELAGEQADQIAILSMLEQMSDVDEELAKRYAEERRQFAPTMSDYQVHRVSALGKWTPLWAWFFWGIELALAGTVGGWVIRRRFKPTSLEPC